MYTIFITVSGGFLWVPVTNVS